MVVRVFQERVNVFYGEDVRPRPAGAGRSNGDHRIFDDVLALEGEVEEAKDGASIILAAGGLQP